MPRRFKIIEFIAVLATWALVAGLAHADETAPPADITLSANVGFVSDYRFRGLSRSNGDPAVQGGITVSHVSGLYLGAWSSSLDLGAAGPLTKAVHGEQEVDLYGGWTGPIGGGLTGDIGLQYYAFPGGHSGKAEFFEPYAAVSATLGPLSGKIGVNYAWRQQALNFNGGGKDDSIYIYGEISAGIPNTPVTLSGHLGRTSGALSPRYATGQTASYDGGLDWALGATYTASRRISLTAQYIGVQGRGIDGYADDTVVGTLRFSF